MPRLGFPRKVFDDGGDISNDLRGKRLTKTGSLEADSYKKKFVPRFFFIYMTVLLLAFDEKDRLSI